MNAPVTANEMLAVAIWKDGPCCSSCDGSGLIDTGSDHGGRRAYATCGACSVEAFGEVESRGMRCPGVGGLACADGMSAAWLTEGAYELSNGALCCAACGERALGAEP